MVLAHKVVFYESPLLTVAVCFGAMLVGLLAGSIAHTISWRITHGSSAWGGGTRCRECGEHLTLRESIPLLGWLTMHGTCPHCGHALGVDRPACELLCALIFGSAVLRHALTLQTLEVLAAVSVLLVASLCSLWDYCIPNGCIWAGVLVRAAYLAALALTGQDVSQLAVSSLVGALALSLPLALAIFLSNAMLVRDVSGMGTVKLVALLGLYLGWQQGLIAMAGACLLWVFVWVLSPSKVLDVEVAGGAHRTDGAEAQVSPRDLRATLEEDIAEPMRLIPFAPPIAIACWLMLLLGVAPQVWNAPIF
jgi:leader peptidase (prepilin peptidase)/N-methyltransferase